MKTVSYVLVIVVLVLSGAVWAQEENIPLPSEEVAGTKMEPATDTEVTAETLTSYLDRMGYTYKLDKSAKIPGIELVMRGNNGNYQMRIFIDDTRKVVYTCVNRLMTIPAMHPRKAVMLQKLMELNWDLLISKYEWDKTGGEVRLSYTFSTENGLGYEAFAACFQLLVLTADRDYPRLMRVMWAPEEKKEPEAQTPATKLEEVAKEKVAEPKQEIAPKEEAPSKEGAGGEKQTPEEQQGEND